MKVLSFDMIPTPKDMDTTGIPKFDNTKMTAINTCPTWGLIRYDSHKTFGSGNSRAMALEAGAAAHEAYAAIRLADLYLNGARWYPDDPHYQEKAVARMEQLFGSDHTSALLDIINGREDTDRKITLVALERFSQSGYYEDPNDRRRTVANIEESLIAYCQRYPIGETMPIVIDDFVGVEIPVDMLCKFEYTNESGEIFHGELRFTGRVDGVHFKNIKKDVIRIEENKTASRVDEAWQTSFELSHQITGYCLAMSTLLSTHLMNQTYVNEAIVRGMAIPLPKNFDYGGIVDVPVKRKDFQFVDWVQWVVNTYHTWRTYHSDPVNAPKYTHSCNRYFRVCPMHPICLSGPEDRAELFEDMNVEEWSPLEEGNA